MKRLINLVFVLVIMHLLTSQALAADANEKVDAVRDSVVRVVAIYKDGYGMGSGFYLGKKDGYQYYATNDHVVSGTDDAGNSPSALGIVFVDFFNSENIIDAEIVYQSYGQGVDLAVIKIVDDKERRKPITLGSSTNIKATNSAFALGFPGAVDDIKAMGSGDVSMASAPSDVTITKGEITNANITVEGNVKGFYMSTSILPGNSGGPSVDENGFVIGINTWKVKSAEKNIAIGVEALIDILDRSSIPYFIQNTAKNGASSKGSAPASNNNDTKKPDDNKPAPPVKPVEGMRTAIIIGIVALVFILFLVLIIAIVKKNSKQTSKDWNTPNKNNW